jgi:hypothetical protein
MSPEEALAFKAATALKSSSLSLLAAFMRRLRVFLASQQ